MGLSDDAGLGPVAFDSAPLVYYVEEHPLFGPVVQPLFEVLGGGTVAGVTSVLTLLEVLVHPLARHRKDLAASYREILLDVEGIELLDVTPPIAERAASLRARYGMRTPDAIQLGTAIEVGATAFVTSDRRLRRIREIPVLVVGQYIRQ